MRQKIFFRPDLYRRYARGNGYVILYVGRVIDHKSGAGDSFETTDDAVKGASHDAGRIPRHNRQQRRMPQKRRRDEGESQGEESERKRVRRWKLIRLTH